MFSPCQRMLSTQMLVARIWNFDASLLVLVLNTAPQNALTEPNIKSQTFLEKFLKETSNFEKEFITYKYPILLYITLLSTSIHL